MITNHESCKLTCKGKIVMETHAYTVLLYFLTLIYFGEGYQWIIYGKIEFELQLNIDIFKTPVHVNGEKTF